MARENLQVPTNNSAAAVAMTRSKSYLSVCSVPFINISGFD
jgi:hypothetical protein